MARQTGVRPLKLHLHYVRLLHDTTESHHNACLISKQHDVQFLVQGGPSMQQRLSCLPRFPARQTGVWPSLTHSIRLLHGNAAVYPSLNDVLSTHICVIGKQNNMRFSPAAGQFKHAVVHLAKLHAGTCLVDTSAQPSSGVCLVACVQGQRMSIMLARCCLDGFFTCTSPYARSVPHPA
jgi:hypothetical protein